MMDLMGFNEAELANLVTKDNVWPKPDYRKMVDSGVSPEWVFLIKYIRDAVPRTPQLQIGIPSRELSENYVKYVGDLRKRTEAVRSVEELKDLRKFWFDNDLLQKTYGRSYTSTRRGYAIVSNKLWQRTNISYISLVSVMTCSDFLGNSKKGSRAASRKKKLTYGALATLASTGYDYRHGLHATQDQILGLGFRAGEYGNWLDQVDRQQNLDHFYDSMLNMSKALGVSETAIANPKALHGSDALAIAFGSRGRAGAAAHYEPLRHVINLTKMHGAGSLAHELGHSIDRVMAESTGNHSGALATDHLQDHPEMKKMIGVLKRRPMTADEVMRYYATEISDSCDKLRRNLKAATRRWAERGGDQEAIDKAIEGCVSEALHSEDYHYFNEETHTFDARSMSPASTALVACKPDHEYFYPGSYNSYRGDIAEACRKYRQACENPGSIYLLQDTEFYQNACALNATYQKDAFGYWNSDAEMFARAFACYIKDKLAEQGIRDDYLTGHADARVFANNGSVPVGTSGAERKLINKGFDEFFDKLKEEHFFD